jgi:glycosyltransferase involved in cell wall biosynthesis
MPRVLHVIESLGLGGAERLLALTVREMKRSQYESVVCHLSDRAVDWRETIEDEGVSVESLGLRSMYDFRAAVAGIRQLVRRWRVDLVHSHLYFPGLYAQLAAWRERLPIVSSMHNLELEPDNLRDNPALTPGKQGALRLASRVAVRLARPTFVAVSDAVRASVIRQLGVAPETVVTIHNGIDPDAYDLLPDGVAARGRLGLSSTTTVLLIVGRLVPLKGHRYLLSALAQLRHAQRDVALLVVGDGPLRASLERFADALDLKAAVHFLGARQGLVEETLAAADIVVVPSLLEGFGLVALEAMAAGRPCVVSRTGGLPEIVEDDDSGILVPAGDVTALTSALDRLVSNPDLRARMGRRGRAVVEARFDIRVGVRQIIRVYDDIVARHAAPQR